MVPKRVLSLRFEPLTTKRFFPSTPVPGRQFEPRPAHLGPVAQDSGADTDRIDPSRNPLACRTTLVASTPEHARASAVESSPRSTPTSSDSLLIPRGSLGARRTAHEAVSQGALVQDARAAAVSQYHLAGRGRPEGERRSRGSHSSMQCTSPHPYDERGLHADYEA
jgi:hypothetical protein